MKFLIFIGFIIFLTVLWKFFLQDRIREIKSNSSSNLSQLFKLLTTDTQTHTVPVTHIETINQEDIRLFDDVAKLLFEKAYQKSKVDYAQQIQSEFLNKMPTQARSQINHFDLEEWSIYWSYKNQSLEYYASKYGIFYTHVDAKGVEHKLEFKRLVA